MNSGRSPVGILLVGCLREANQLSPDDLHVLNPLPDKPALQLAVEIMVRQACKQLHLFVQEAPATIRAHLGNGERWGIDIAYHYWNQELTLADNVKRLALVDLCWLGCAEWLPRELLTEGPAWQCEPDTALSFEFGEVPCWSGWGLFNPGTLAACTLMPVQPIPGATQRLAQQPVSVPLELTSDAKYLSGCLGRLTMSEIVIARGAHIHPSAQLTGPLLIGRNVRIEAETILGPNVVIGENSVVDRQAEIRDSVILPGTYVGIGLSLEQAIASPLTLSSIRHQTRVTAIESHLLTAALPQPEQRWKRPAVLLLHTLLHPLAMLGKLLLGQRGQPSASTTTIPAFKTAPYADQTSCVELPISHTVPPRTRGAWLTHFVHTFHPGLRAVAARKLNIFGPALRNIDDISLLPPDWQSIYHEHPCGLLNEMILMPGCQYDPDLAHAADVCACAGLTLGRRLQILWHYAGRVLIDLCQLLQPQPLTIEKAKVPTEL